MSKAKNYYIDLREENDKLIKQVDSLKDKVKELSKRRKIQGTPFSMNLSKLGFDTRIVNSLNMIYCNTLADLVVIDRLSVMKAPSLGLASLKRIEARLDYFGLQLGMDLNNMSDSDFDNHVSLLIKLTENTKKTDETIGKTESELRRKISKLENLLSKKDYQLGKKNGKLESLDKDLKIAKEKLSSQKDALLVLRKAKESNTKSSGKLKQLEAEIESLKQRLHSRGQKEKVIFEHKEATMKTWIKGLEEDLASKREYIKSLEAAQKELQEENAKLKAQVVESDK